MTDEPTTDEVDLDALRAAVLDAVATFEQAVETQAGYFAEACNGAVDNFKSDVAQAGDTFERTVTSQAEHFCGAAKDAGNNLVEQINAAFDEAAGPGVSQQPR